MTMTNAEWMIKEGHKFIELDAKYIVQDHGCRITLNGETLEIVPLVDITNAIIYWLDMEHKEPILDEAEKQYLSAAIKPFRKYVIGIRLQDVGVTSNQRVTVFYNDYVFGRSSFALPTFKKGTMYKGMEVGRRYTLEELGL